MPLKILKEKNRVNLSRKVDKATKYDRDYIWNLVHAQLAERKLFTVSR